ncbi:MAG TPA: siroheme synthase CysG [Rhizomicrobium sp.]|nr:siroheme synthase CysG [Rhizomicrobium sp.]
MRYLPVVLDLNRGFVAVVGATPPALGKLRILRDLGASVRWFPCDGAATIRPVPDGGGPLEIIEGEPAAQDIANVIAVISAAGGGTDERIARIAREFRTPINVVDRQDLSSFIFPAIVDRGDVVVAISTGGAAPMLARRLRAQIETLLPKRIGQLAGFLGRWRAKFKQRGGENLASGRVFWEKIVDGPIAVRVLEGREREADDLMSALGKTGVESKGSVAIVGAGPGDPDLLTLKALHALQNADIIFYDDLVTPEILARSRREAVKVFVGKRKGRPGQTQSEINARLVATARAGNRVVRLKGGDPFIFGRGGEEIEALREAGVAFTVVPGITAALGCAAEAELPLTFRNEAASLVFVTAHRSQDAPPIDWASAGGADATLVVYMGQSCAAKVRDGVIAAGRDPATPACVLARGTRAHARAQVGRLDELPLLAARAGDGPAILVIGNAVAHSRPWSDLALQSDIPAVA